MPPAAQQPNNDVIVTRIERFINERSQSDSERAEEKRLRQRREAFRTEMCRANLRGHCPYGEGCRFAHDITQLRVRPLPHKYKTQLCRNFTASGFCMYGHRCQYIHRRPQPLLQQQISPPSAVYIDPAAIWMPPISPISYYQLIFSYVP